MPPATPDYLYCTEGDVAQFLSVDGETGRVDDDASGTISPTEQTYVTRAIAHATGRVNLYCLKTYTAADLATSQVVCDWATIIACHWLSRRRGNPPPGSTKDAYGEAMAEMKLVAAGDLQLDLGARFSLAPAWSNCRIELMNQLRKVVVERPISDGGSAGTAARQPAATPDVGADFVYDRR